MKKNLRLLVMAAVGLVAAVAFSSCTYDPYYTSVGGSYSTGYGDGYGYGGSSFSTSVFVGTGNPRWGYDPYCYSYYDYNRRAYYDPYLNGYYPVGYRPQVVYGVSHPYGWSPGRGYLRPPSRVNNVTIVNYRDRESAYRRSGYVTSGRSYNQRPVQGGYSGGNYPSRPVPGGSNVGSYPSRQTQRGYNGAAFPSSPARVNPYSRQNPETRPSVQPYQQGSGSGRSRTNGTQQTPRYPSRYNTPVASQPDYSRGNRSRSAPQAAPTAQRQIRQLAPPDQSRAPRQRTQVPQPQAAQPQAQQSQPRNPQAAPRGSRGNREGGQPQEDGSGRRGRGIGTE